MIIRKNTAVIVSIIVCICVFVSGICVRSVFKKDEKPELPVIIIDAGHGGADGGAICADNTAEKVINLEISKKLEALCKFFGYKVIMTRESDDAICDDWCKTIRQKKVSDIKNRFKIIQENPNSLFISIHQNKYSNSSMSGTQTFYSPNNISSMRLAECIQNSVVASLQSDNTRQIKKSGTEIFLLYHAQSTAVMVECGFVSNLNELKKLKNENYQKQMAFAILSGINDYIVSCNI